MNKTNSLTDGAMCESHLIHSGSVAPMLKLESLPASLTHRLIWSTLLITGSMKSNWLWRVSHAGGWRRTPHLLALQTRRLSCLMKAKAVYLSLFYVLPLARKLSARSLLSRCSRLRRSAHAQFQRWWRCDVSGAFLLFSKQVTCFFAFQEVSCW